MSHQQHSWRATTVSSLFFLLVSTVFVSIGVLDFIETQNSLFNQTETIIYNAFAAWLVLAGLWLAAIVIVNICSTLLEVKMIGAYRRIGMVVLLVPLAVLVVTPWASDAYWEPKFKAQGYQLCRDAAPSLTTKISSRYWSSNGCQSFD